MQQRRVMGVPIRHNTVRPVCCYHVLLRIILSLQMCVICYNVLLISYFLPLQ